MTNNLLILVFADVVKNMLQSLLKLTLIIVMIRVPSHFIEMELLGNAFLVKPTNK